MSEDGSIIRLVVGLSGLMTGLSLEVVSGLATGLSLDLHQV